MPNFKEIFKLKDMPEKVKIPFVFRELKDFGGYQILYPEIGKNNICDVILHEHSYGRERGGGYLRLWVLLMKKLLVMKLRVILQLKNVSIE